MSKFTFSASDNAIDPAAPPRGSGGNSVAQRVGSLAPNPVIGKSASRDPFGQNAGASPSVPSLIEVPDLVSIPPLTGTSRPRFTPAPCVEAAARPIFGPLPDEPVTTNDPDLPYPRELLLALLECLRGRF